MATSALDAMIQTDAAGGMRPHLAWASGGLKVLVREEHAQATRRFLSRNLLAEP
jgi:hypothetical protein